MIMFVSIAYGQTNNYKYSITTPAVILPEGDVQTQIDAAGDSIYNDTTFVKVADISEDAYNTAAQDDSIWSAKIDSLYTAWNIADIGSGSGSGILGSDSVKFDSTSFQILVYVGDSVSYFNADSTKVIPTEPTEPTNLVTNGTFDSDLSGWTVGADWAWSSGTALHTASSAEEMTQTILEAGKTYDISIDISGRTAGAITVYFGGIGTTTWTTNGTHTDQVTANSSSFRISPWDTFDGAIDNIIVTEVE